MGCHSIVVYVAVCDRCGAQFTDTFGRPSTAPSPAAAEALALEGGWKLRRSWLRELSARLWDEPGDDLFCEACYSTRPRNRLS